MKHMAVVVDYQMREVRAYASPVYHTHAGWWQSTRYLVKTVKGTNRLCKESALLALRRLGPPTHTNADGQTYEQIDDVFRGVC